MAERKSWRATRGRLSFHVSAEPLEPRALLSGMTFDVINNADSGDGSLRMAITEANANPGSTIDFAIQKGPLTIDVLSPLPAITAPVLIDGTSQPGYAGTPLVTVSGQIQRVQASGFVFVKGSDGSAIEGLAVTGFGLAGIEVERSIEHHDRRIDCGAGKQSIRQYGRGRAHLGPGRVGKHRRGKCDWPGRIGRAPAAQRHRR